MSYYEEPPERPKDPPSEIAKGIGLAAASLMAAWGADSAGFSPMWWWGVVTAAVGGMAYGVVYAVSVALEWVVPRWLGMVQERPSSAPRQDGQQGMGDTKAVEFTARPAARAIPEWRQLLERRLWDDGRFVVGNRPVWLPDSIDVDHLYLLAEWRAAGKLLDVSTRSLHEIGITRFGESPNAQSLIDFLLASGAIQDAGERRPYTWTQIGEDTFPTPLPQNDNGNIHGSGGGGTSGIHHSTTATTTDYH